MGQDFKDQYFISAGYGGCQPPKGGEQDNRKPTAQETLYTLGNLKSQFDRQAADYLRMSTAISDAMTLIKDGERAKREAEQLRKLTERSKALEGAAALFAAMGKSGAKHEYTILSDGSGSMSQPLAARGRSLIEESLQSGFDLKTAAKKGGQDNVKQLIWGDSEPLLLDIKEASDIDKFRNGINCGTDLAPVAEKLAAAPADAKKHQHLIIASDGDLFDHAKSLEAFGQVLGKNKNTTVDFVVFGRPAFDRNGSYKTQMEDMAEKLRAVFPAQVSVARVNPADEDATFNTFLKIATARASKAEEPKAKPPKAPKAAK